MILIGVGVIAYGIIGGLISYYQDRHSFDIVQMMDAGPTAVIQAVVFTIVGAIIIAWYTIGPGGGRGNTDDDQDRTGMTD
jgi:hypothetical protein